MRTSAGGSLAIAPTMVAPCRRMERKYQATAQYTHSTEPKGNPRPRSSTDLSPSARAEKRPGIRRIPCKPTDPQPVRVRSTVRLQGPFEDAAIVDVFEGSSRAGPITGMWESPGNHRNSVTRPPLASWDETGHTDRLGGAPYSADRPLCPCVASCVVFSSARNGAGSSAECEATSAGGRTGSVLAAWTPLA